MGAQFNLEDLTPFGKRQFLRVLEQGGIRGGDGTEEDGEEEEDDEDGEEEDPPKKSKVKKTADNPYGFTPEQQRRVTRMLAKEKGDGKRSAMREFADENGIDPDDLAEIVAAHKKNADDDQKSKDKLATDAQKEKDKREQAEKDLAKEKFDRRVERQLLAAGVPVGSLEKVLRLVDLETDAEVDEIKDEVKDLKKQFPALFNSEASDEDDEEEEDDGKPPYPVPTPKDRGSQPKPRKTTGDAQKAAQDLFDKRHPARVKR